MASRVWMQAAWVQEAWVQVVRAWIRAWVGVMCGLIHNFLLPLMLLPAQPNQTGAHQALALQCLCGQEVLGLVPQRACGQRVQGTQSLHLFFQPHRCSILVGIQLMMRVVPS